MPDLDAIADGIATNLAWAALCVLAAFGRTLAEVARNYSKKPSSLRFRTGQQ